jgi:energy-converting hydrogenase Eha subunit H
MKRLLAVALGLAMTGAVTGADLVDVYTLAEQNDPGLLAARASRSAALEAKPIARSSCCRSSRW